jgi:hypothetical protein
VDQLAVATPFEGVIEPRALGARKQWQRDLEIADIFRALSGGLEKEHDFRMEHADSAVIDPRRLVQIWLNGSSGSGCFSSKNRKVPPALLQR